MDGRSSELVAGDRLIFQISHLIGPLLLSEFDFLDASPVQFFSFVGLIVAMIGLVVLLFPGLSAPLASRFDCSPGVTSVRILRSKEEGAHQRLSAMTSAPRLCPKCGTEIPADAPEGGCPGCLLESGLNLLSDEAVAGGVEPGRVDKPTRAATKSERAAKMLGELGDYELLEEDRSGRSGRGVSRATKESQSHGRVKSH